MGAPAPCPLRVCAMPVPCSRSARSLPTLCPPHAHSVPVLCPLHAHSLPTPCSRHARSVLMPCPLIAHSMPVPCLLHALSMPVLCPHCAHEGPSLRSPGAAACVGHGGKPGGVRGAQAGRRQMPGWVRGEREGKKWGRRDEETAWGVLAGGAHRPAQRSTTFMADGRAVGGGEDSSVGTHPGLHSWYEEYLKPKTLEIQWVQREVFRELPFSE